MYPAEKASDQMAIAKIMNASARSSHLCGADNIPIIFRELGGPEGTEWRRR